MTLLSAGVLLGRYELLAPLAKGGMAQVWAAQEQDTEHVVAIKTILASALEDPRMERMFRQEALLASRVHHPNVVKTLQLGEANETLYLVMEWVHGEPLRHVLHEATKHGITPLTIAVHLIGQACLGLHAAHEARSATGEPLGIVHRDISPHNLLVTYEGRLKLVDFGVAKADVNAEELTERGELKGKLAFMSPEQVAEEPLDRRSDIFSLAGILYWACAGKHPFRASSPGATRDGIRSKTPPPPPSALREECPPALDQVVLKGLDFQSENRFATCLQMYEALVEALPQAFEGTAEQETATYMTKLFGSRSEARIEQIRFAQKVVAQMREDATSVRSLRGVSMAQGSSRPPASIGTLAPPSTPPIRASHTGIIAAVTTGASLALALWLQPTTPKASPPPPPLQRQTPATLPPPGKVSEPDAGLPLLELDGGIPFRPQAHRARTHSDEPATEIHETPPVAPSDAAPQRRKKRPDPWNSNSFGDRH